MLRLRIINTLLKSQDPVRPRRMDPNLPCRRRCRPFPLRRPSWPRRTLASGPVIVLAISRSYHKILLLYVIREQARTNVSAMSVLQFFSCNSSISFQENVKQLTESVAHCEMSFFEMVGPPFSYSWSPSGLRTPGLRISDRAGPKLGRGEVHTIFEIYLCGLWKFSISLKMRKSYEFFFNLKKGRPPTFSRTQMLVNQSGVNKFRPSSTCRKDAPFARDFINLPVGRGHCRWTFRFYWKLSKKFWKWSFEGGGVQKTLGEFGEKIYGGSSFSCQKSVACILSTAKRAWVKIL